HVRSLVFLLLEQQSSEEVAKLHNCGAVRESVSWSVRMQSSANPQSDSPAPAWSARIFGAIAFAAFLGILPLLIKGNVAAHDLQFHISSWTEFAQQWRHGIVWPRWAAGANYGFGE